MAVHKWADLNKKKLKELIQNNSGLSIEDATHLLDNLESVFESAIHCRPFNISFPRGIPVGVLSCIFHNVSLRLGNTNVAGLLTANQVFDDDKDETGP